MKGEYVGRWKEERSRKDRGIAGKDKKKEGGRNERIRKDEGNAWRGNKEKENRIYIEYILFSLNKEQLKNGFR